MGPPSRAESVPKRAPLFASARAAPAHETSVARAPGSHPAHPRISPGAATPHAPAAASPCGRRASFPGCWRTAGLSRDPSARFLWAMASRGWPSHLRPSPSGPRPTFGGLSLILSTRTHAALLSIPESEKTILTRLLP